MSRLTKSLVWAVFVILAIVWWKIPLQGSPGTVFAASVLVWSVLLATAILLTKGHKKRLVRRCPECGFTIGKADVRTLKNVRTYRHALCPSCEKFRVKRFQKRWE